MEHQDTKGKSGQDNLKSELYRLIQTDETIFNFILESSYDGMWYRDLTTDKAFFSSRWKEKLGYEDHELKNEAGTFTELIYEKDLEFFNEKSEQYLSGKNREYKIEFRMKHKNGSLLWILAKGIALWDEKGRAYRMVGTISDVTKKIYANIRLKQSEHKLKATLNSTPEGNILISPDYKILLFNRQSQKNALKVFGRPLLEMANYMDYLPESDIENFMQDSQKVFNGEQLQYDINMAGGWFQVSCYPVYYDDGKLLGMSISSSSIDKRKKAEEELRLSNQRFQLIMEATNDGFWDWNVKTDETNYNPACYTMLGYQEGGVSTKNSFFDQLLHPDEKERVLNTVNQCVEGSVDQFEHEFRMKTLKGEWIWVFSRGKCVEREKNGKAIRILGAHVNITERKQADEKRHLADETYLGIINGVAESIYIQDKDGVFLEVNNAAIKSHGLKREDLIGKTPEILSADGKNNMPLIAEMIKKAFNGEPQRFEFWGKSADGTVFPDEVTLTKGVYFGKDVVIALTRNISERKQAEENIRQNQKLLQSISDNMFDFVALTDLEGNYTFVGASHKILGYETSKLTGTNLMEYVHPDDLTVVKSAFEETLHKFDDKKKIQYRNRCADGSFLWFETIGRCIYDEKGNPQQILFNSRDITERRRADEALRESEERFRMLAELAPVGIIITDEKQNPAYVSPAFSKIFGYTIQDIPTVSDWFCLAYPDEHTRNKVKQKWFEFSERVKNETGVNTPMEHPVHCKNGSEKHIEFRLAISGNFHVILFTDITERLKSQEGIVKERMQLLSILNSIDEIIYISDIENHEILYINKKSEEILKKNCIGEKCYKEFQNLDSPCSFCTNSIITDNNEQPYYWDFHNHFINKHYAITDRLIDWPDGRKVRLEIAIDVTQQKIAEQALRESEERFRSLFENATIGIYRTTPDGKILMANPTLIKMLGYNSFDELEKRNLLPEGFDSKTTGNTFKQQIEEKGEVRAIESAWKIKDGSTVFVSESTRAFRDKKGDILYFEGTVEDITKRKKAEEKVLMLSKGIEQSPAILVITDRNGTIEYVNPMFTKATGYSPAEALGKNPRILKSGNHSKEFYRDLWETILRGKDWQGEILNKKKDGTTYWESTIISPIFDKNGHITHFMAIKEDITYRKQAEEVHKELEIANKTARFKQNFLANMSHEIRTPLTGVLGMIEIMEQTSLTFDQSDYLNTIKTSGENLREIINQVLDYSKIEAGKVSIYPRVFEFTYLPESAMSLYKNNVNAGVKLQSTIDPKIPVWIEADKARLSQVFNNLLSNAVKFTSQGAITIQSSLVSSDPDKGQIIIKVEVSDTGLGIPEDLHRKLFIPFSQIEAVDIRNYEGTGLGLSICKQLIELMEGEIGVISEEGKGSTFWFTFPAKTAHKPKMPVQKDGASVSAKKLHILLAEDKMVNQKVVKLMLTSMGHKVCIAQNGKEAIDLYQPDRFDLILMDIQMPVMDGVTATQKLKEKHKYLPPIVGLSANAFEGDREKYMTLGMDEYLTKPVKKKDILALLEKL